MTYASLTPSLRWFATLLMLGGAACGAASKAPAAGPVPAEASAPAPDGEPVATVEAAEAPPVSCAPAIASLASERAALTAAAEPDFDGSLLLCDTGGVFGPFRVAQAGAALTLSAMHEGAEVALSGGHDGKTLVAVSADGRYGVRLRFTTNVMGIATAEGEVVRDDGSTCEPTPVSCH